MNAVEPLEGRLFCSATPEKFNLISLLGYNLAGASYKYRTMGTFDDGDPSDSTSETFSTKQTVGTKKQTYDGHASTIVKLSDTDPATTITGAWFGDSTGSYLLLRSVVTDEFNITEKLHDTRVGPKSMTVGTKYSDTGTADGSASFRVQGQTLNGTFSGTSSVTAKISGRQSVTVRGKVYSDAVKGTITTVLNGKLRVTIRGHSESAPITMTETQTFWAKPGVGAVRLQDKYVFSLTPPGEGTKTATITANSDLVSYVLPA
jgi:hypothetical protein